MAHAASGNNLVFSYSLKELKQSFLESGNNIIDLAVASDGEPLYEDFIESFPFMEEEVTDVLWQRLFDYPFEIISKELKKIAASDYSTVSIDDVDNDSATDVTIAIKSCTKYQESDLEAIDRCFRDNLIYGALLEWFENSNKQQLVQYAQAKFNEMRTLMVSLIRRLTHSLLRETIADPFTTTNYYIVNS